MSDYDSHKEWTLFLLGGLWGFWLAIMVVVASGKLS